jgi:TetR/AcrR family transcriptional regulator, regulator of autoinduction and epiphytic fitness
MTAPGTKRAYDASRRRQQARLTRRRILDAAAELFVSKGYAGTTIAETAAAAGVAQQTVYKAFGTKRAILKELVDVRIAGDDEPVAVMDRPFVRRILDEPDGRRKLEIFAEHLREVHERTVDVLTALRAAADSDPEVADLWETLKKQRHYGQTVFARHLAEAGVLRHDLSPAEAADVISTLMDHELYRSLSRDHGWSGEAWQRWYADLLARALLRP